MKSWFYPYHSHCLQTTNNLTKYILNYQERLLLKPLLAIKTPLIGLFPIEETGLAPIYKIIRIGYRITMERTSYMLCLPGEIAVIIHAHVPRNMIKGRWKCNNMEGYTSCGSGISLVPARFFCQPEVVLLTLVQDRNAE